MAARSTAPPAAAPPPWPVYEQPFHCTIEECSRCNMMWRPLHEQNFGMYSYVASMSNANAANCLTLVLNRVHANRADLKRVIEQHGDGIKLKWDTSSVDQRRALLGDLALLGTNKWADIERSCAAESPVLRRDDNSAVYYLPYLSKESLVHDPSVLYNLLHQRAFHHPSEFAAGDLYEVQKSLVSGTINEVFNRQCVHVSELRYGQIAEWSVSAAHSGRILSMPQARVVATAQDFLLSILKDIAIKLAPEGSAGWNKAAASDFPSEKDGDFGLDSIGRTKDDDEDEPPIPKMTRLMASPFMLHKPLDPHLFLEIATERLSDAEDALRFMQSDSEHVQTVVKDLRKLKWYKGLEKIRVWGNLACDIWLPLFSRAQAWRIVKARAETLVKAYESNTRDLATSETLPSNLATAYKALHRSIKAQAFGFARLEISEAVPKSTCVQDFFPLVPGSKSKMDIDFEWTASEFQEQPLVWACSKLEAFWTAVRPVKQNEALMAVKFLSEHFAQHGSEGSERLAAGISDLSTYLWLSSILEVACPAEPDCFRIPGEERQNLYSSLKTAIKLPDSEYELTNNVQFMPSSEHTGLARVTDANELRLALAGKRLQFLCEMTPWPRNDTRDIKWLVASTHARRALLKFWEEIHNAHVANIVADNPTKKIDQTRTVDNYYWEIRVASFFRSKEIRMEYQGELDSIITQKQQYAAVLDQMQKAEQRRIAMYGNRYNEEWVRKSEPRPTAVKKGRRKGKKAGKAPSPVKPKPIDANSKIFIAFMDEFAAFFNQDMPPSPPSTPPPSPARLMIRRDNFAIVCWMFPNDPANKVKQPGSKTWVHFRAAMLDAGFPSRCTGGSEYVFEGRTLDGENHRIIFHDPTHGTNRSMPNYKLRKNGKRLSSRFDWTFDSFRMRG